MRACFFVFDGCLYQLLVYFVFKLQMHLGTGQRYSPFANGSCNKALLVTEGTNVGVFCIESCSRKTEFFFLTNLADTLILRFLLLLNSMQPDNSLMPEKPD